MRKNTINSKDVDHKQISLTHFEETIHLYMILQVNVGFLTFCKV